MSKNKHAFPWGIYIGNLIDNSNKLPIYLPSHVGGFSVIYDDDSETDANNFIENIALKLFEVLPDRAIKVNVFDFGYKKRFIDLSLLKDENLYEISLSSDEAHSKFKKLEQISLHRHHDLLSSKIKTISQYNQVTKTIESYHLLLINLNHYPDNLSEPEKIKEFFESAYEVGFYTIAFGNKSVLDSKLKAIQDITNKFPIMEFKNKNVVFTKKLFEYTNLTQEYDFKYIDDNKNTIINNIFKSLQKFSNIESKEESIK
jgi:hypothetical protein